MALLQDVTIVSVEQYGAGPWATMYLRELGAEIIKIERPGKGDIGRYVPPYASDGDSLYFQYKNRGKKSVSLDIAEPEGYEVFCRLVERADAVFNNLRGDVPARLGIDYDSLKSRNPRIVCGSVPGYGSQTSRAHEPGYDYIMQARAGWMSITGEPGTPPSKSGLSLVDLSAGVSGALALVAGIVGARATGEGRQVEVSLYDTAISALTYIATWHLSKGYEPERQRRSRHPSQVPSQVFPTRDGYIVIMCQKEKFWSRMCELSGWDDLIQDHRFSAFESRLEYRDELEAILDKRLETQDTNHWLGLFEGSVPCAPVNDVPTALRDPLVAEAGLIVETSHPHFGTIRQPRSPLNVGLDIGNELAPSLGEHTGEILERLAHLSLSEIDHLRSLGVVD